MTPLPRPRGPRSASVLAALLTTPDDGPRDFAAADGPEDDALTLWVLHELHYRGFAGVDGRWEWQTSTIGLRTELERALEDRLRARRPEPVVTGDLAADLLRVVADDDGPSLARHVQRRATREQTLQLLRQRSLYHLKEADPTSWVIPRLPAGPKAALLEIQFDEYGNGDPRRLHHRLFQAGIEASGLRPDYAAYVDEAVLEVLEQNNALSMFGLQRRLRGAALGHLAAFEGTSSLPSRQLAQGLRRLDFPEEMAGYYDEHVEADAVHEQLALRDICVALVTAEPDLYDDVLLGAWACLDLEARTADALLTLWDAA
ncbi:iron-containing redox enzyme family protein [Nocardioides psychrotolerans]|uniref:iron-containing redox enzyme family protein n=1 Tax=Nocardioides psychrotolerans TaxID=1005945 RepID=UPI0031377DAF